MSSRCRENRVDYRFANQGGEELREVLEQSIGGENMISLRARLLFFLVRISGLKNRLLKPGWDQKFVARDHARGPASPGRWLRKHCDIEKVEINGQPLYRLNSRENVTSLHIFYLHGGGYAFNIVSLHWHFVKKLIRRTGASVTVPIYPLSPENKWDSSYAMVMEAFEQAVSRYGAENIVVMGDSAGGGFSLGLAQMLRNQRKALPGKLVLLSPYLDQTAADPMQMELEKIDILISVEGIRRLGSWWMRDGEDPAMFPASPLFETVDRLPPMLVFAGTDEVLLADSLRLKKKGDDEGAEIELKIYDHMQHVWMLLPIPEAKRALNEIVEFLLPSKI